MTFKLDTSGAVYDNRHGSIAGRAVTKWEDLSPFTQGYIEALFGSATYLNQGKHIITDASPTNLWKVGFSDLAPETLARIIADCEAQLDRNGRSNKRINGAGFWEVRQAGFRGYAFPPLTVQLGDDGKVRFA